MHKVGPNKVDMYGPVDIEVYFGINDKNSLYVIDFARLFPPTKPQGGKNSHLYYLFRPEFMSNHHTPLSPDAFSSYFTLLFLYYYYYYYYYHYHYYYYYFIVIIIIIIIIAIVFFYIIL